MLLRRQRGRRWPLRWLAPGRAPRAARRLCCGCRQPSDVRSAVGRAEKGCMWNFGTTSLCFGDCTGTSWEHCANARSLLRARHRPVVGAPSCTGRRLAAADGQSSFCSGGASGAGQSLGSLDSLLQYACVRTVCTLTCARVCDGLCCVYRVYTLYGSRGMSGGSMCAQTSNPTHCELGLVSVGRGPVEGTVDTATEAARRPECASLHG